MRVQRTARHARQSKRPRTTMRAKGPNLGRPRRGAAKCHIRQHPACGGAQNDGFGHRNLVDDVVPVADELLEDLHAWVHLLHAFRGSAAIIGSVTRKGTGEARDSTDV